ncbi:unnamed protein product [Cyprideis torosa]|uniref:Uncharacterized protein n=1 Tax=Cyprideis torosa TaxID=163714 RepID=A0A7R8WNL2_9CRUS|nr:unnamed protein product [Cyprideis torosa]CAG0900777.1 unnamed protein product [Cyprideis torosa]
MFASKKRKIDFHEEDEADENEAARDEILQFVLSEGFSEKAVQRMFRIIELCGGQVPFAAKTVLKEVVSQRKKVIFHCDDHGNQQVTMFSSKKRKIDFHEEDEADENEAARDEILQFVLSEGFSEKAVQRMFRIIELCGGQVPFAAKTFLKEVVSQRKKVIFHCDDHGNQCETCQKPLKRPFILFDVGKTLAKLLLGRQASGSFNSREKSGSISDVMDGAEYKTLRKNLRLGSEDFTFNLATDGVQAFNSSSKSLWPVYLIVNELPPNQRFKNKLIVGLWTVDSLKDLSMKLEYLNLTWTFTMDFMHTVLEGVMKRLMAYLDNEKLKLFQHGTNKDNGSVLIV